MALSRFDTWTKSQTGAATPGTQVFICSQPANISTNPTPQVQLFSDPNGLATISQPLVTDGFGHAFCYVAQGTYTVVIVYGGVVTLVLPDQSLQNNLTLASTFTPQSHQYLTGYSSITGEFSAQQPVFEDLSDTAAPTQLPIMVGDSGSGGVQGIVPAPPAGSAALKFLRGDGTWQVPAGTGIGLSSVGLSTNSTWLTVSNSPLVTNGVIALNLTTGLTQNQFLATPDGSTGAVGLREIVVNDLPYLPANIITSGILALARGGNTFNALGDLIYGGPSAAPTVLSGNTTAARQFLSQTGTGSASAAPVWAALTAADIPSLSGTYLPLTGGVLTGPFVATQVTAPVAIDQQSSGVSAYTAVLADADQMVTMSSASASTFTVPIFANVAFPLGTVLTVIQLGAGQITITPYAGVTLHTASSLTTRALYSVVSMVNVATNTWVVFGDLS